MRGSLLFSAFVLGACVGAMVYRGKKKLDAMLDEMMQFEDDEDCCEGCCGSCDCNDGGGTEEYVHPDVVEDVDAVMPMIMTEPYDPDDWVV